MEENKNMEMEVQNEMTDMVELPPMESESNESSGPSKGFVTLVVGGLAAAVAGGIVAFRRHKKKKLEKEFDDFVDVDGEEISDEEEDDNQVDGNDQEPKVVK